MDVLSPELQYINGICYRINPGNYNQGFNNEAPLPYEFDSESWTQTQEPEVDDHFEVENLENGRLRTSFHVAKIFFPYLIGTKGATKKRIESETKTVISIPRQGCEGNIVITGGSRQNVCSARNRIHMLIISFRRKMKPTHYLAFPLDNEVIKERFNKFKKCVMECAPHIPEGYFQQPDRLHITIGVLTLCDDKERADTSATMKQCVDEVVKNFIVGAIPIKIKGLECLNDDPSAVNVVYAKVVSTDGSDILQALADKIFLFFQGKGLMTEQRDRVLIHATLINTSFKGSDDTKKICIDASKVFELYGDFDFGEGYIQRIDLVTRFSDKQTSARLCNLRGSGDMYKSSQAMDNETPSTSRTAIAKPIQSCEVMTDSSANEKPKSTLYLVFPLDNSWLQERFCVFKRCVMECSPHVLDGYFQPVDCFHIIIGEITLTSEEDTVRASASMKHCIEKFVRPSLSQSVPVRVRGLECHDKYLSGAKVIYARVSPEDGSNMLQTLADKIFHYFESKGLMVEQKKHVHMLATLIDTSYKGIGITINAKKLYEFYKNFDFGQGNVKRIDLVTRLSHTQSSSSVCYPHLSESNEAVQTKTGTDLYDMSKRSCKVMSAGKRSKSKPTHFLAFTLDSEVIHNRFSEFKRNAMKCCPAVGDGFFKPYQSIHIILGDVTLCDEHDFNKGLAALKYCIDNIVNPALVKAVPVKVKGLKCLHNNPSAVNVIYARVSSTDGSDILQKLAEKIWLYFQERGFTTERADQFRFHATLINTFYNGSNVTFDASKIFELYKDYDFGEGKIDQIDLVARTRDKSSSRTRSLRRTSSKPPKVTKLRTLLTKLSYSSDVLTDGGFLKISKPTHLVVFILDGKTLSQRFLEFKSYVTECAPHILPKYFQPVNHLCIVIGNLTIKDGPDMAKASAAIRHCITEIVTPTLTGPVKVRVKGLECANHDPSAVNIIHAKVVGDDDSLIQEWADRTFFYFQEQGLAAELKDFVRLNAILINTFYGGRKDTIDASRVFEMLKEFDFGEVNIGRIELVARCYDTEQAPRSVRDSQMNKAISTNQKPIGPKPVISMPKQMSEVITERRVRKTVKSTRFLSFTVTSAAIQERINIFKASVMKCSPNIQENFFQPNNFVHIIIGNLAINYKKDKAKVIEAMDDCVAEVVRPTSVENVQVRVKGLECLNNNPSAVNEVFTKICSVDGSDYLQKLANNIFHYFKAKGFTKEENPNVNLHATLINTRYGGTEDTIDASEVFKLFRDFDFGVGSVDRIEMVRRKTVFSTLDD